MAALVLAAAVWLPLEVGFDWFYFVTDLGVFIGLLVSGFLANRGDLARSSNLLLVVMVLALGLGITRETDTSAHHLLLVGLLIPVMMAFFLDRMVVALGLVSGTILFLAFHAAHFAHPPGEMATLALVFVAGSSIGGLDAFLRLRERHRAEAAETESGRLRELNEMRMQFINTAAHDLRTPLTPLKLSMATLRLGNQDAKQAASLDMMQRNVSRFEMLIEDMLDASRLQAGRLTLKRAPVELDSLVHEALESFREAMLKGGLSVDARGVQRVRIDADPLKASQVVMNLLSNAVKYTPAGGTVTLEARAGSSEATFVVKDTGLGMTPEQIARLFQPFVRLHEGQPGVAKGTGLGLYITKGIVEAHGGQVAVASGGPGQGSTFTVTWPLAPPPALADVPLPSAPLAHQA
jgi:signal transduction histidine kinase